LSILPHTKTPPGRSDREIDQRSGFYPEADDPPSPPPRGRREGYGPASQGQRIPRPRRRHRNPISQTWRNQGRRADGSVSLSD
jgi:hypothetical protein